MEVKRKLKTLNNKTGEKIVSKLRRMVDNHERYRRCYFWSNTGSAANRRKQEFQECISFCLDGVEYEWTQDLDISCKNFYWTSSIYRNGKKSNIKAIQSLLP